MVVNPTTRRVRAVIENLTDFIAKSGDDHQKRMGRVLNIIIDETIEELGERDEKQMQRWMMFMSRVLEWSGTGNIGILPIELIPFIADVEGITVGEATKRWEEANGAFDMSPLMSSDPEVIDAEIVDE